MSINNNIFYYHSDHWGSAAYLKNISLLVRYYTNAPVCKVAILGFCHLTFKP